MEFTKEAVFARLAAAYTGPGSTEEGSFAGDVLRACADAMAELYSTQIDGLAQRAFVASAAGEDLTALCADRGVTRQAGEEDASLRERTLARLRATPASGNADHYAAWAGSVEGILRVKVLPLARGNGTVDILALNAQGRAADTALLAAAQAAVDENRPVGADARVLAPAETVMDTAAQVTLMEGGSLEAVRAEFTAAMAQLCAQTALRSSVVSYAKALRLLMDCAGVADVTNFTLLGTTQSAALAERAVPVAGTAALTLKEAGV